jgi:GntR family transcriptional regulator
MDIVISDSAKEPIYRQIYRQICGQIIRGELPNEYCLPAIRTVAKELRISVITIKRAWEELELDGFIRTMAKKGCFVSALHPGERHDLRNALAAERMQKDVEYYRTLGLSLSEILDMIQTLYPNG